MSSTSPSRGPARETRLLLLTLAVSVGVLFVLARFRFPERPISELAPQPLARLARATTFDDLSATLGELLRRAADAQVALRVSSRGQAGSRLVPALRVRDDLAIAVLPGDAQVDAVEGGDSASGNLGSSGGSLEVARDEVRGLVLVRVPVRPAPSLPVQSSSEPLELPGFLVLIDAAPGGPAVHAEFVSRVTSPSHPAWDAPILALGGIATARPGSLVFTLAGRFVGMVLSDEDNTLVAPAEALIARADRLTRGESVLAANARLAVQPLSPALAKATKADHGVIVAAINDAIVTVHDTNGPPIGPPNPGLAVVRVGDVITAVDADEVRSLADWERILSHRAPGMTVSLRLMRPDGPATARLMLTWHSATLAPPDPAANAAAAAGTMRTSASAGVEANRGVHAFGFGLVVIPTGSDSDSGSRSTGSSRSRGSSGSADATTLQVAHVDRGSAADRAGLHPGDRLTALPVAYPASAAYASIAEKSMLDPPPQPLTLARVDAAFNALARGNALLLAISRAGQPLVVAVEKP